MRTNSLMLVAAAMCSIACASQSADDGANTADGISNGNSATKPGATGVTNSGGTQSSNSGVFTGTGSTGIPLGVGGATNTGPSSGMTAEQTPDGLLSITSDQAKTILGDPATSCAGWAEEPESVASVVEFIVDVSGSMNKTTSGTQGKTKWAVTQTSLHGAIDTLPAGLPVGLTFFPNMSLSASNTPRPVTACVNSTKDVAIAPLTDTQRTTLTSTVDAMRANSNGATPTHDAFNIALTNIRANSNPGQKYLVLITDGQPTQSQGCVGSGMTCTPEPTQPVVDAIAAALKDDNVKTFIVGSPGSEKNDCTNADVRDWLSAAARVGGTAPAGCSDKGPNYCHFDLSQATDFGKALSDALGSIVRTVVSCDYSVPAAPGGKTIDTSLVNMIYNDGAGNYSLVLPSKAATCEKGWNFADASLTKLHVCNETCNLLQGNSKASVSLVFGCTQQQIQTPLL